jgi:transposase
VRRKFFDLFSANKSLHAQTALEMIQALYQVERHVQSLSAEQRDQYRQQKAKPIAQQLLAWLQTQRSQIPPGTGLAKAIDYTLKRWQALTRYLQQPDY